MLGVLPREPIREKRVQRTIEYINRSFGFFHQTEYLLGMFENGPFYIDYIVEKKVALQESRLPVSA